MHAQTSYNMKLTRCQCRLSLFNKVAEQDSQPLSIADVQRHRHITLTLKHFSDNSSLTDTRICSIGRAGFLNKINFTYK